MANPACTLCTEEPKAFLQDLAIYGYDCRVGYCSMFKSDAITKRIFHYSIGFLLPLSTIFCREGSMSSEQN